MLYEARARMVRYTPKAIRPRTSGPRRTSARPAKNESTASKNDSNDSPMAAVGATAAKGKRSGEPLRAPYLSSRESLRSFSTRPPVCSCGQ